MACENLKSIWFFFKKQRHINVSLDVQRAFFYVKKERNNLKAQFYAALHSAATLNYTSNMLWRLIWGRMQWRNSATRWQYLQMGLGEKIQIVPKNQRNKRKRGNLMTIEKARTSFCIKETSCYKLILWTFFSVIPVNGWFPADSWKKKFHVLLLRHRLLPGWVFIAGCSLKYYHIRT